MRIGLTAKLLMVRGLASAVSVMAMALAARWSFQHGFLDYLGQQELKGRPGPREVRNAVNAQSTSIPNNRGASDFFWQWVKFLDHDIDLTDGVDPPEPASILIPVGDPWFDPSASGTETMAFNHCVYDPETGIDSDKDILSFASLRLCERNSDVYGRTLARLSHQANLSKRG